MEIVEKENIKVPNSLIISGLSHTSVDEEIVDYLKQYGLIARIVRIDNSESEFHKQAIVEFESGEAVQTIEAILPLERPSSADPKIIHHVQTLSSVYSGNAGTKVTHTFLSELKDIAKLSGKSFEDILREELTRITDTINDPNQPVSEELTTPSTTAIAPPNLTQAKESKLTTVETPLQAEPATPLFSPVQGETMHNFNLSPEHLSTPDVQRVVVEHIVKSTDIASQFHSPAKLRSFSGRVPCPNYEVDYDTWRTSVDFYLTDPTVSQSQLVRRIADSLLPPAANVVKPLGPQAPPHAYLDLLDSAYATIEDGDELFAKFLNTHQNAGEKPSGYLHRLQSSLNAAVRKKTVCARDADKQLLKQFCRGCWNNSLIATLQLEQKQNDPPSFSELLLLLRTEEDKQAAKASRMKQHLGITKPKVQANAQAACINDIDDYDVQTQDNSMSTAVEQIKKQIANLQAQISAFSVAKGEQAVRSKTAKTQKAKANENRPIPQIPQKQSPGKTPSLRPRPWYCFKCGEDGHIVASCSNPPNPQLVDTKRKQLKERQQAWDKKNTPSDTPPLN